MQFYSKLALSKLFGISRATLARYVDWHKLQGHPEDAERPKYSPYDVGRVLGYDKAKVDELIKENS